MDEEFSTSLEELSDVEEEIMVKPKKKVRFADQTEEIKGSNKSLSKSFQNTFVVFILLSILSQVDITNFLTNIIKKTRVGAFGSSIILSLLFSVIFFVINYFVI